LSTWLLSLSSAWSFLCPASRSQPSALKAVTVDGSGRVWGVVDTGNFSLVSFDVGAWGAACHRVVLVIVSGESVMCVVCVCAPLRVIVRRQRRRRSPSALRFADCGGVLRRHDDDGGAGGWCVALSPDDVADPPTPL
jgi:hypothetical protein